MVMYHRTYIVIFGNDNYDDGLIGEKKMKHVKKELNLLEALDRVERIYNYEAQSTYISTRFLDALQYLMNYAVNAVPYKWLDVHYPVATERWEIDNEN